MQASFGSLVVGTFVSDELVSSGGSAAHIMQQSAAVGWLTSWATSLITSPALPQLWSHMAVLLLWHPFDHGAIFPPPRSLGPHI